jgi:hypothetical protein
MPNDFYNIFPEAKENAIFKTWNDVDIINMKRCNLFLNRSNIPLIFDVILLDGGEFTTYYEYKLLEDRCKILMLDDTNTNKCRLIVKDIISKPDKWEILKMGNTRNGFLVAQRL